MRSSRATSRWRCSRLARFGALGVATLTMSLLAPPAWACSVCFGAGDPDASGFAWGVLILLVPVAMVQILLLRFVLRAVRREQLGGGRRGPLSLEAADDSSSGHSARGQWAQ